MSRNRKPSGMTPITSTGLRVGDQSVVRSPSGRRQTGAASRRGSGSPPERASPAPPGVASASVKSRPSCGWTPSACRTSWVTNSARACSGSPMPVIVRPAVAVQADVLKDAALVAIREVLRRRHAELVDVEAGRNLLDADELVGVRVGQRLDQHAIDDAEDRGVGADAERQREHDGQREPWAPAHAAQRQAQIAARAHRAGRWCSCDRSPRGSAPCFPSLTCAARRAASGDMPRAMFSVGLDLEVRAQLLGAIAVPVRSAEEPAPAHGLLRRRA